MEESGSEGLEEFLQEEKSTLFKVVVGFHPVILLTIKRSIDRFILQYKTCRPTVDTASLEYELQYETNIIILHGSGMAFWHLPATLVSNNSIADKYTTNI